MKEFLIKHKSALILSILVGVIMAFPHIYFVIVHQDIYQGVFMGGLDESFYLVRIQEIRDGHFSLANPVWLEGKDLPYLRPPFSEVIASFPGQIFGIGLINTVLLENFFFPAFIFLLIYFLTYQLIKKKSVALLSSLAVLLISNLVDSRAVWDLMINQETNNVFLSYTRLISPQVHSLFFFGFFLLFWLFLEKRNWIYGGTSGIILGLSFYVYPYTWTFIYVFLGVLILISLFRKNYPCIKNIILIMGGGLIMSIPYFINLWRAMNHPFYPELSLRTGVIESHSLQIGATILILLAIFLLFFPKKIKKRYDFCLALTLAPFVVLNQQVITGHLLTSAHYHYYYHKPIAIIILTIITFHVFKRKIKSNIGNILWSGFVIVVLFVSFYNAILSQRNAYLRYEPNAIDNQRYGVVFKWLNSHGQKDEVVLSDFVISEFIPIYTSLNTVSNMDGHYYLVSSEDTLLERLFLQYRLDGLKPKNAKEVFFQEREKISKKMYGQRYRKTLGNYEMIPDEKLSLFSQKYGDFIKIPLWDIFKKYHVKYVVWDAVKHPNWELKQYDFLNLVYQENNLRVYEIK